MAYRLFGLKPLSVPMMAYYYFDILQEKSAMRLHIGNHFV